MEPWLQKVGRKDKQTGSEDLEFAYIFKNFKSKPSLLQQANWPKEPFQVLGALHIYFNAAILCYNMELHDLKKPYPCNSEVWKYHFSVNEK